MKLQFFVLMAVFGVLGVIPSAGDTGITHGDHLLHFLGWLVGGVSGRLAYPHASLVWTGFALWIYSLGIELAQIAVPTRSFELADLVSNGAGIILGLLAMRLLRPGPS